MRAPHRTRYQKVERKSSESARSKFKSAVRGGAHSDDEQDPPTVSTTATLLPGRYGSAAGRKEYEVRSNLRNFSEGAGERELSHCAVYREDIITEDYFSKQSA